MGSGPLRFFLPTRLGPTGGSHFFFSGGYKENFEEFEKKPHIPKVLPFDPFCHLDLLVHSIVRYPTSTKGNRMTMREDRALFEPGTRLDETHHLEKVSKGEIRIKSEIQNFPPKILNLNFNRKQRSLQWKLVPASL